MQPLAGNGRNSPSNGNAMHLSGLTHHDLFGRISNSVRIRLKVRPARSTPASGNPETLLSVLDNSIGHAKIPPISGKLYVGPLGPDNPPVL
jgi:hypothetical protein